MEQQGTTIDMVNGLAEIADYMVLRLPGWLMLINQIVERKIFITRQQSR